MNTHHIPSALLSNEGYATVASIKLIWDGQQYGSYSLGFSPEGQPGRQVFEGPLVSELFGWLNENASVISLHKFVDDRPTIMFGVGDIFDIEGHGKFEVVAGSRFDRRPKLVAIPA